MEENRKPKNIIDSQEYCQIISDKETKAVQWTKDMFFSKLCQKN